MLTKQPRIAREGRGQGVAPLRVVVLSTILILAGFLLASSAWAGPQVLSWDPIAVATSYGVEQSLDNGVTWTASPLVVPQSCDATRCFATVNAPTTGRALYRIWAANSVGRTTRFSAGLWVCESCAPPPTATNVGVQ